jgi:predicted transcriptional regulator of viral defense system
MDILFEIYKDSRTVFRINDIALLLNTDDVFLRKKLNGLVKKGKLLNLRRGIYAKEGYNFEELACVLYTPTYISFEKALLAAGVIFQYSDAITNASYLSREIIIDNQTIKYRKLKGEILVNPQGVILNQNNINIATPERAFLDMLYLNKNYYFDYTHSLNKRKLYDLVEIYNSPALFKQLKTYFPK